MIITIDGPVGTGKSTIAKLLAERLGFLHVDTGAMYRCVAYGVIKHRVDPGDSAQIQSFLEGFTFDLKQVDKQKHYYFEGEDITAKIRALAVTSIVSKISAIREVREKLVELQRKLGMGANAIFEGRDMGTVVFPHADLKIFLTANPKERARRRLEELKQKFPEDTKDLLFEEVLESVNQRDSSDSSRELSPLKAANDAHILDTTNLSIEEVLVLIIQLKDTV